MGSRPDDLTRTNIEMINGSRGLNEFVQFHRDQVPSGVNRRERVCDSGMILASLQRHLIVHGDLHTDPGDLLPDHRRTCETQADPGDPPREVVEEYVFGPSFIDSPAEKLFKANVITVSALYTTVYDTVGWLRDIAAWQDPTAAEAMHASARMLEQANHAHRDQARQTDDMRADFRDWVRGFYQALRLLGQRWEGINAAHAAPVAAADPLLGTRWNDWDVYAAQVVRHMLHGSRQHVTAIADSGSLLDAFISAAGATSLQTITADAMTPALRSNLVGFIDLLRRHAAVGNAHVGVIKSVLKEDPTASTSGDRATPIEVGSGGRPVDTVIAIARHRTAVADLVASTATSLGIHEHRHLHNVRRTA